MYSTAETRIIATSDLFSRILAGTPSASAPGGTTTWFGTTALAPTVAPLPMTAQWRTTLPDPANDSSSRVQPSKWVRCPTTQPSPMTVGNPGPACTTVPSWTEVRAPTVIVP